MAKAKAKARAKPRRGKQLTLAIGAKRRRKPAPALYRRRMAHRPRPAHEAAHPVHVTMRAAKGIPSFREQVVHRELKAILQAQLRRDYGPSFQVVHFTIQENHLHLIVEAKAPTAEQVKASPRLLSKRARKGRDTKERDMLRRGIAGLAISFARRLNGILKRKGPVWAERHHRRELKSPTEVRTALLYVLQNHRRHGALIFGDDAGIVDPLCTGTSFDGWAEPHITWNETEPWHPPPRTWLLRIGWLRAGGKLSTRIAPPIAPHTKPIPYRPYAVE